MPAKEDHAGGHHRKTKNPRAEEWGGKALCWLWPTSPANVSSPHPTGLSAALSISFCFPSSPLVLHCKLLCLALFLSISLQTFVSVVGFTLSLITLSMVIWLRQMCSSALSVLMTPSTPKLQLSVKAFSWTLWLPGTYSTLLFARFKGILNLKIWVVFFLISLPYVVVFLMSVNGNSILILTLDSFSFSLSCPIFYLSAMMPPWILTLFLHHCHDKTPSSPGSPLLASCCHGGLHSIFHTVATDSSLLFSNTPVAVWLLSSSDPGSHVNKLHGLLSDSLGILSTISCLTSVPKSHLPRPPFYSWMQQSCSFLFHHPSIFPEGSLPK